MKIYKIIFKDLLNKCLNDNGCITFLKKTRKEIYLNGDIYYFCGENDNFIYVIKKTRKI